MNKIVLFIVSIFLFVLLFGIYAYAKSQGIDVLEPQGYISSHQRDLFLIAISLGMIALIPVFIITYSVVHRYHEQNPKSNHRFQRYFQIKPEAGAIWAVFISIIIASLAVILVRSTIGVDPYTPIQGHGQSKAIRVVALPWKWLFIYPEEGIASVNELVIPVDQPITFELTADSPMSSFWIPKLGGMIYTMEGMVTKINLMATSPGQFEGKNTEINGAGYAGMKFTTKAVSDSQYQQWVEQVKTQPQQLDWATYQILAEHSINHPVEHFASADPGLFGQILAQFGGHYHTESQATSTETHAHQTSPSAHLLQSTPSATGTHH